MTTPEEMLEKLRHIRTRDDGDTEDRHIDADNLMVDVLRELGYGDAMDEYRRVNMWWPR